MTNMARTAIVLAALVPLMSGCVTGNQNQTEAQVGATYRIVKNLESTVVPSVTKLNESTADLSARADASDKEIGKLQSMSEDNQKRLERIQSKLDKLANALYKQQGISGPSESTAPATPAPPTADGPSIEPPKVTAPKPEPVPETPAPKPETPPTGSKPEPVPPPKPETSSNAAADFAAAQASYDAKKYSDAARQFQGIPAALSGQ